MPRWGFVYELPEGGTVGFSILDEEVTIRISKNNRTIEATIPSKDFHILCEAETIEASEKENTHGETQ